MILGKKRHFDCRYKISHPSGARQCSNVADQVFIQNSVHIPICAEHVRPWLRERGLTLDQVLKGNK